MNSGEASLPRQFMLQRADTAVAFASAIQRNKKSCDLKPDRQTLVGHGPFAGLGGDWAGPNQELQM
jgi:hypothetical protein